MSVEIIRSGERKRSCEILGKFSFFEMSSFQVRFVVILWENKNKQISEALLFFG